MLAIRFNNFFQRDDHVLSAALLLNELLLGKAIHRSLVTSSTVFLFHYDG